MLLEIITPAVVGRSEQILSWSHRITARELDQVLGIRVGQVVTAVASDNGRPQAVLTVDADLWCAAKAETKVIHTRCHRYHEVLVKTERPILGEETYRIELVGGPRSTGVRIDGESLTVDFEATVSVEMTALTRFWVKASEDPPVYSGSRWHEELEHAESIGSH